MYYNDYEWAVIGYLQHYSDWKTFQHNAEIEIKALEANIALDPAPKTSQFRDTPPIGGFESGGPQEAIYEQKEDNLLRLKNLRTEKNKIDSMLTRIDNSLEALDGPTRNMVIQRGVYRFSWKAIAHREGYDESYCRKKWRDGIHRISGMLFGPKAAPVQTNLVFL